MKGIENFESRFEISGIRFYADELKKTVCTDFGYRITKGAKGSYVTGTKESHSAKYYNYMMKIGTFTIDGESKDIYTQDLVDYVVKSTGERAAGVIVYDNEKFMYAVKDCKSEQTHPLHECAICQVFTNIYEKPDLVGIDLEMLYIKYGRKMKPYIEEEIIEGKKLEELEEKVEVKSEVKSEEKLEKVEEYDYAYLDEDIPGLTDTKANKKPQKKMYGRYAAKESLEEEKAEDEKLVNVFIAPISVDGNMCWSYKLSSRGRELCDSGKFNKKGKNDGYYAAANLVIALSKVHDNVSSGLKIHTAYEPLIQIIKDGLLEKWSSNDWIKPDGKPVKNADVLAQVQANLIRIGGNIQIAYEKNLILGIA